MSDFGSPDWFFLSTLFFPLQMAYLFKMLPLQLIDSHTMPPSPKLLFFCIWVKVERVDLWELSSSLILCVGEASIGGGVGVFRG